nr:DUF2645 family protein [Affinibrenneria salicis]
MNGKHFTFSFIYALFCFFNIAYFSYFKQEQYVDGDEVKTACDAYRIFMVDDIRSTTAPLTFIMLLPFFIYA